MILLKKIFLYIAIFFLILSKSYATEKISYLDMEYVIKNSNLGKSLLEKINKENDKNIKILKKREEELKKQEDELMKKKNIISKEEFEKEIIELRTKIKNFRSEKNDMVKNINDIKNKELSKLYEKINPIIQAYMEKNDVEILLDMKNIIMGKSSSNISNSIIEVINNKFN
tara:strand:- start:472 stop:984 length:513 start_codon:yes stop_codon:yes gene_type:complete